MSVGVLVVQTNQLLGTTTMTVPQVVVLLGMKTSKVDRFTLRMLG